MRFWSIISLLSFPMIAINSVSSNREQTAFFQGLGSFPDGRHTTDAGMVSADGTAVIATGLQKYGGLGAYFWSLENTNEKIRLGAIPSSASSFAWTTPTATNGTVVVGKVTTSERKEAFIWTKADGTKNLGDLPSGEFESGANAVSADGTVVAGTGTSDQGKEAFIWTEANGMKSLGDLPGGEFDSTVNDLSADGTVVAGTGTSEQGKEAFIWTEANGMRGLGDLAGGEFDSTVVDLSADGTVVVGVGNFETREPGIPGHEAFIWTEADGMVGLGHLSSNLPTSIARAVSDDGSTVVGISFIRSGEWEVFVWDKIRGMRPLKDVLEQEYGLDLSDWSLTEVGDISADGLTIVGSGFNWQEKREEGWVAKLDS